MRKFRLVILCACTLLGVSCSQNDFTSVDESGEIGVGFTVKTAQGPQGRGLGIPQGNDETNQINRVEIYAFKASDGKLERRVEASSKTEAISMRLTKGEKRFYAVANATNKGITTEGDLLRVTNALSESQVAPFTMVSAPVNYTITELDEGKSISMTVVRFVSRVQLKYETEFENSDDRLSVDSIYIMKANSSINYKREANTQVNGGWIKSDSPFFAQYLLATTYTPWTQSPVPFNGSSAFYFYIFSNDAPAKLADATSIVIAGKYNGKRSYYRIDVNVKKNNNDISYGESTDQHQYVRSNTIYNIKATIKGEGTDVPTENPVNLSFWIQAADWNYVEQSEEF